MFGAVGSSIRMGLRYGIKDGRQLSAGVWVGICEPRTSMEETSFLVTVRKGTGGFNAHILDVYDASRLQDGLRFGDHQRMM